MPPKKLPAALLALSGSHRAKDRAATEIKAPTGEPARPAWVKQDDERELWAEVIEELRALNLLAETDGKVIGNYCCDLARRLRLMETLREEGEIISAVMKYGIVKKPHPAVGIIAALSNQIAKATATLGLSPSARASLRVPPKAPEPETDENGTIKGAARFLK